MFNVILISPLIPFRVTLADQTTYDAKIVGYDQDKDVAVLRVNAPRNKLRPLPVGVSADLLVGQKVYAIGNPVSMPSFSPLFYFYFSSSPSNFID